MTEALHPGRHARRTLQGVVVSDRMDKTIAVLVDRTYKHAKYGKYMRKSKKYHAHDEREEAGIGDLVEIAAARALSRTKRWRLVRVITKNTGKMGGEGETSIKALLGDTSAPAAPARAGEPSAPAGGSR